MNDVIDWEKVVVKATLNVFAEVLDISILDGKLRLEILDGDLKHIRTFLISDEVRRNLLTGVREEIPHAKEWSKDTKDLVALHQSVDVFAMFRREE